MRCAAYTRKSTEEGLEQEFNSLDAQRESAEAYIASQKQEGWVCLPDRYDDGGFTGGNMDRPALRRLLADIEAGKVDAVVVYKIDRLSRSLLDFAKMMDVFERHHVAFCSVTQQFNSATSMGRLVLNVLLSFAQFEREIIAERTRDKIAAARRKGKWSGGLPILGYDTDPKDPKLIVNPEEAARIQTIFALYLEHRGLVPVVEELNLRGWVTKRWTTRKGRQRGGRPFSKTNLHQLLTNVTYVGKVRYKSEIHTGEHPALIDPETWQRVQALLQRNGRGGGEVRNRAGALLQGLLHCGPCGYAMSPTYATKKGRRYRYYVCTAAQKRGWQGCPSKSVPAGAIEGFVVDRIKAVGQDPAVLAAVVAQARRQGQERLTEMEVERRALERDLARWNTEVRAVLGQITPGNAEETALARLADLQERIRAAEQRGAAIRAETTVLSRDLVDQAEVAAVLGQFDLLWEALTPQEQARVVRLLVERVVYDGARGKVAITSIPRASRRWPDSFARLQAAVSDPFTATDAQVAPFADAALQYDGQQRVTQAVIQGSGCSSASEGGLGTYSYSYTDSTNTAGFNSWATKTVETRPDGNTNTVYTNAYGEVMLAVFEGQTTSQQWEGFEHFDSQGRIDLLAAPSALTGFDESSPDLLVSTNGNYQYLSDTDGLIQIISYYTTTTATETTPGGVAGYEQGESA
jgi:site-specific DNA recombinase